MNILIKNLTGEVRLLHEFEFQIDEIREINTSWYRDDVIQAVSNEEFQVYNSLGPVEGLVAQLAWLKGDQREVEVSNSICIEEQPPFAKPDYRTKWDATDAVVSILKGEVKEIDFKLTEEFWVSGGELIIKNWEFGDALCASVYDKDSQIPEPYRATMCEAWPIVAKYINKRWTSPDCMMGATPYGKCIVNTKPLNAKITANLYLRVGYGAVNSGETREVVMNYDLAKKL